MPDSTLSFPQYCTHAASNWIIWIIFILFMVITILEIFWGKQINHFLKSHIRGLYRKPLLAISLSVLILIFLSYCFERNGVGLFVNSNLLSILSVVGILGTIIGVILTYEQLKIAEDRIDGYEKLYSELHNMMEDKSNIKKFQFYGPTIIPGQIAYGNEEDIKLYRNQIYALVSRLNKNFEVIVPSEKLNTEAYSYYNNQVINNKTYDSPEILKLLKEIKSLQDTIGDNEGVITEEKSKVEIIDNFYFSNGYTVIYAIPLHFQVAIAGAENITSENKDKNSSNNGKMHPELIGFKTTNRSIVKAFELSFIKLKSKINVEA
jgi:hypothetical protein